MNHSEQEHKNVYLSLIRHKKIVLVALIGLVLVSILLNLAIGSTDIAPADILRALFSSDVTPFLHTAIWDLRLPMALMAVVVGASLGIGGCEVQTILRNPLASPYTIGISAAASFGAAVGIILEANFFNVSSPMIVTANSFFFTMISALVIYGFSSRKKSNRYSIVLFGIALNFLFSAFTMLLQYIADEDELQSLVFWSFGSLLKTNWTKLAIVSAVLVVCFILFRRSAWKLTAMVLSDGKAKSLGVNVDRIRRNVIVWVALLTAASVCFVGTIGFIGLIAPHIARSLVGEEQRYFMPVSGLIGAAVLGISFTLSKLVMPGTVLPIGLLTSVLGIPFFVAIIFRRKESGF